MRPATLLATALLLALSACSVDQTEFIAEYATAECDFAMRCYDPSILEFYGWSDANECVETRGPEITGDAEGCTYDKKQAKACLKAMKELPCPSGDPVVPEVCTQVFACDGDTTDTSTETDTL